MTRFPEAERSLGPASAPPDLSRPRTGSALPAASRAALTLVLLLAVLTPGTGQAGTIAGKVADCLARWQATHAATAAGIAPHRWTHLAEPGGVPVGPDGAIQCWVLCAPGADPSRWSDRVGGCAVEGKLGDAVQVRIPLDHLRTLADLPEVRHVGLPPRPLALVESEGLDSMRVREFWSRSGRGGGVRIGILDIGFTGYENLLGSELPAQVHVRPFYHNTRGELDITGDGEIHGTACAEVVHDVAPDAELYLTNAGSPAELEQAEQWLVDSGVEVISHSVGWFFGKGDGTGAIDDIAAAARNNGVMWVNAAGNFALSFWTGSCETVAGDGSVQVLNNRGGAESTVTLGTTFPNETVEVALLWDHWPTSSDLDFEIDLLSPSGQTLATSQTSSPDPYALRVLDYPVSQRTDSLRVRIRRISGSGLGSVLRLVRTDGELATRFMVADGSLANPADSPEVLAVGAYEWSSEALELYSSRGPTTDGRMKPEILGPDCVSTYTYHEQGPFCGTSAATPHVAGAVGLILGAAPQGAFFAPRWSLEDVLGRLRLEAETVDALDPNGVGWGRIRLPLGPPASSGARLAVTGYGPGGVVRLRLTGAAPGSGNLQLFDVAGRLRGTLVPAFTSPGVRTYAPSSMPAALRERGRFWAFDPVSGAGVSFYWNGNRR